MPATAATASATARMRRRCLFSVTLLPIIPSSSLVVPRAEKAVFGRASTPSVHAGGHPLRGSARLSYDQLDREHGDVRRRLRVVDQLDERSRRGNAERLLVLADRRQRRADELRKLDVVE